MKKSVVVIGLGRLGMSMVKTLAESKCDVVAIDNNKDRVSEAGKYIQHAIICDSTNLEHLEEAGIQNVHHAVLCIGENIQASILTLINLKELGIEKISVRVDSEEYVKVMMSLGATEVMFPERDFGIDVAKRISIKNTTSIESYFDLEGGFVLVKFKVKEDFEPTLIRDLSPIHKYDIIINLIIRDDKVMLPNGDTEILANDELYVVGKHAKVVKFEEYLN